MRKTILYVEDNHSNVIVVQRVAKNLGCDLLVAVDGQTGLDIARSKLPDLILMDIGLPDIDGLEVTSLLRAETATAQTPIVAVTAHAMNGDRQRCIAAGCDEYLSKPYQVKELSAIIHQFLGSQIGEPHA
jgi:two-component system cell cycle response regulator DivK